MIAGAKLTDIEAAAAIVYRRLPPTPQIHWPLLSERTGCEVWVKHENHGPLGAFKARGGLVYFDWLAVSMPDTRGVIAATRGNHGQSIAFAARCHSLSATIVVPHGNSREKNAAMRAHGARLIEYGRDFQEALEHAHEIAARDHLHFVPSIHPRLIAGVGTYALEFFRTKDDLDTVYVPIGMGSGICGMIAVREGLGLKTEIVGVVADGAPAYALSFEAGRAVATDTANTFIDGVACRKPDPTAVETICRHAARVIRVSDDEARAAMRFLYQDTHNLAEPAGAIGLAALLRERDLVRGHRVGIVLSGANVDLEVYRSVLEGD